MNARHSQSLYLLTLFTDLTMAALAWCLAYVLRFHSTLDVPLGQPPTALYVKIIPFLFVIWLLAAGFTGLLKRTGKHANALMEGFDLLPTAAIAVLMLITFTYFYEEYRYSRITLLFFGILQPLCILLGRHLIRRGYHWYVRHQEPRQLLIIARGYGLLQALTVLRGFDPLTRPAILLPGDDDKEQDETIVRQRGIEIVPEPSDWTKFFVEQPTHALLIALPASHSSFIDHHLEAISHQVPEIKILPDIARFTKLNPGIELVEGLPLISVHESPLAGSNLLAKRLMDIAGSAFALLIFSPIMFLVVLAIRFTSRGPALYKQERMGLDGSSFQCLKFRSMPLDVEKETGAVWAKAGENRATPVGNFLRRTSLDELPQFFNVLMGDMSLVGPRPERPVFVRQFRQEISGYMLRHKVKTGMTGWAQVNGWRGSTSLEKRIECDLYYIQNWSLWLDIKILFMTVDEVVRGRNAY
ncbi:MAG: undecaprenyl-phosphate glucose phosphotransferase [Bdellovibrionota bacterium]|nr:MAG: undecaprenyl-phosphate glucose phosphotransferase [Pseudomonadota bacterium]